MIYCFLNTKMLISMQSYNRLLPLIFLNNRNCFIYNSKFLVTFASIKPKIFQELCNNKEDGRSKISNAHQRRNP